MTSAGPRLLIVDACVLIDFCDADASVLGIISRHVGQLHVVSTVLDEVEQLDQNQAASLGLVVIEPTLDMLDASARKRGRLSPRDHICLLLAKVNEWTCVSNDKALRTACGQDGVSVMWGLEVLGLAAASGGISPSEAEAVARRIGEANPFITDAIIDAFVAKYLRAKP